MGANHRADEAARSWSPQIPETPAADFVERSSTKPSDSRTDRPANIGDILYFEKIKRLRWFGHVSWRV